MLKLHEKVETEGGNLLAMLTDSMAVAHAEIEEIRGCLDRLFEAEIRSV